MDLYDRWNTSVLISICGIWIDRISYVDVSLIIASKGKICIEADSVLIYKCLCVYNWCDVFNKISNHKVYHVLVF